MGDHVTGRRAAPLGEIFGGVRIGDERRVVAPGEGTVDGRPDARVGLSAHDDEMTDASFDQTIFEIGGLEGIAVVLVDDRLPAGGDEFGHDLPAIGSWTMLAREAVAYPDHRCALGAGAIDQGRDVGDGLVAFVGLGDHRVLHVHDEKGRGVAADESAHELNANAPLVGPKLDFRAASLSDQSPSEDATMTAVELMIEPRLRPVGKGTVRRLLPFRKRRMVGPFIFCDLMGPEDLDPGQGMSIDAHPHLGLSTLTYLLDGRAVHRDSTGAVQTIEAGAVNWMTAGSGVTHTERSHPDDADRSTSLFGAQIWVALPLDGEDGPAGFEHCAAADVPTLNGPGFGLRVAVGEAFGEAAPITGSSPLSLTEIRLDDGAFRLIRDYPEQAVLALSSGLSIGGTPLPEGSMAVLDDSSTPELVGTGTALMLGGEPVGTRSIWWNFVHSDPERIEAAKADWIAQRFPLVPGDHEPWVALPG